MTDDRQARVERILARRRTDGRQWWTSPRPPGPAPLSFVQQGLWLSWRLDDDRIEGIRPTAYRLRGHIAPTSVASALEKIIARHETLRTTFPLVGDEPVQVVHPPRTVNLPLVDVSRAVSPETAAREAAEKHLDQRFDLEQDFPIDPILIKLGDDDHLLALRIHHIVFDGWSEQVLAQELRTQLGSEPDPAPSLDIQYADFATWQRSTITDESLEASISYWREQITPLPDTPTLPRTSLEPTAGPAASAIVLDADLSEAVDSLGRAMGATTFMVLLAAVETLIARLSNQPDFLVGVSTAGRDKPGTESLIGCFINTLLVRADLGDAPTFRQLVDRTRTQLLTGMSHAHVPYSRIIAEVRPWAEGDHRPLFGVHFQMRDFPVEPGPTSDISVEPEPPVGSIPRQLAFRARHGEGGTEISVSYDAGHFDRSVVDGWLRHLETFLRSVTSDPDQAVDRVPLLGPADRSDLLDRCGNASGAASANSDLVPHLFEDRVRRQPEALAYLDDGSSTSYRQMSELVDRVTSHLRQVGAAGSPIAMFLPRGLHSVVATFGILAARSACAPIDTDVTADWLEYIVRDSGCATILTDLDHAERASELGVPVAVIEEILAEPRSDPGVLGLADSDVAFILYTSGSTGRPKGVILDHRNLAEFIDHHGPRYELGPGDRVIQFHSIGFDGSLTNFVSPLCHGAAVVKRSDDAVGSIERFLDWVADMEITHVFVPTSFFHELAYRVGERSLQVPDKVRFCGFGGERLRADAVGAWHGSVGTRVRVLNTYGPTETTVWVTSKELTMPTDADLIEVPIGRPSPRASIYLLDHHGVPVPIGGVGELCIGGPQVGRGYLNRPDETKDRFVPDPFRRESTMYRSGDLASWRADGEILFLGRGDRQVKVRGFRIELEAIEHVLRAHPLVADAAVIVRAGPGDSPHLAAFVETASALDPASLRRVAAGSLPAFMRPHSITILDRLPRTLSGKLDGRALADRPTTTTSEETEMSTDIRATVQSAWASVLEVEHVPDRATFFELGGHSLLAIRLLNRIRDEIGVDLPLTTLFTHAEFDEFAKEVERAHDGSRSSDANEPKQVVERPSDLDALLAEIENLTDEEAAALLAELEGEAQA